MIVFINDIIISILTTLKYLHKVLFDDASVLVLVMVWYWLGNIPLAYVMVTKTGNIWVRSWNCVCLVTWFCYQLIAKPGNKMAAVWPDPYQLGRPQRVQLHTFLISIQSGISFTATWCLLSWHTRPGYLQLESSVNSVHPISSQHVSTEELQRSARQWEGTTNI